MISKQKEIFNELVGESFEEITDLDEKVNNDNLIYRYKGWTADAKFEKFNNALDIIDKIRNSKTSLTDVKSNRTKFKSNLTEVKKAYKNRAKEQKDTLYNTETLYKARNEAIEFYDNYSSMMSEAKLKATKRAILKLLTPKQMLQRLPITLAHVKAGNISKNLSNEIRQIVYSLYQSKEITKKVYKKIIKSIQ